MSPSVAVLIPCRNEELTIYDVVAAFKKQLPDARVVVCDNGSTDKTAKEAERAGAEVIYESKPGKGRAVHRLFTEIVADVYILIDGDDTYDPSVAGEIVRLVYDERVDFVNVSRVPEEKNSFPFGHRLGNRVISGVLHKVFKSSIKDVLSGYKGLSKRYVKSFPILSRSFEIETEMIAHAESLSMNIKEIEAFYRPRRKDSESKLHTFSDGFKIIKAIFNLLRQERPLAFFMTAGLVLAIISLILGYPVIIDFIHTHKVPRLPTAVLSTGIMILGFLSATAGLVLDTVTRGRKEVKLLFYMADENAARQ
jgi:glycosyltransferase involved in cell wall biosynthesis